MGCKTVAQGNEGDSKCLEYSVVEIEGCEVVEGEDGKSLATGDYVYLDKETQIHTCDPEILGPDVF